MLSRGLMFIILFFAKEQPLFSQSLDSIKVKQNRNQSDSILFEKRNIYLFCRQGGNKTSFIAKDFNIADTLSSHIGFGIFYKDTFTVFSITTNYVGKNGALKIENFTSFLNESETKGCKIYKIKINAIEHGKLKTFLDTIITKKYAFDYQFELEGTDKSYCSRFCVLFLKRINNNDFSFKPIRKSLTGYPLIKAMLKNKEYLDYYPIDFFNANRRIKFVNHVKVNK